MQLLKYGELCIGTTPTCGKTFLPLIMSEYRHKFPHIKVQIKTANEETLLTMIEKDEIELAFFGHNPLLSPSSTLTMQSLGRSSFALIAPPDHPWAQWKIVSPAQLLEENFISYSKDTAHYCFVNDFFLNNKLNPNNSGDNGAAPTRYSGFGIGIAMEIMYERSETRSHHTFSSESCWINR